MTRTKHVTREPLLETPVETTVAGVGLGDALGGHVWRKNDYCISGATGYIMKSIKCFSQRFYGLLNTPLFTVDGI